MSRLLHSPVLRSFRHFILALMLLAIAGLFITSHTHGDGSGAVSNTPAPASYFDPSLYTQEELSLSTINDGIPDVWKKYYGFSLADHGLAQADYNGSGVTNLVKYLANLWPLDTTPPQPPAPLPKPATKPSTTAKALTASASAAGANVLPNPPLLTNGTFSAPATLDHTSKNGYGGITFNWGYNTAINGWKALHGSLIEIWSVHGNQFVELDTKVGSYGIKQQVVNAKAGTYLLTWKHRGRDSALAGNNAYRAFVYTEKYGEFSRVTLKEIKLPVPPLVVSKTDWQPQVMAFTVTDADLAAAGGAQKSLWIAFEPDGNNSYGALIDDVTLSPVEVVQPALLSDAVTVAGDPVQTSAVRFARWHQAFIEPGGLFKKNWIKDDDDRVIIRFLDGTINESFSMVEVKVTGIDALAGRTSDTGYVKLQKKNGLWESDPIIFVADVIDADKYNGDLGQFMGFQRDQTRLAGFNADISLGVTLKGQIAPTSFHLTKMMKPARTFNVKVNTLDAFGPANANDKKTAQTFFNTAKLIYRQIGVDLVQKGGVNPVQLRADFIAIYHKNPFEFTTATIGKNDNKTFREYLSDLSSNQGELQLYYGRFPVQDKDNNDQTGFSAIGSNFGFISLFKAKNDPVGGYDTAHELGHALGNRHADSPQEDGRYPDRVMNSVIPLARAKGNHLDARRFFENKEQELEEQKTIYQDRRGASN